MNASKGRVALAHFEGRFQRADEYAAKKATEEAAKPVLQRKSRTRPDVYTERENEIIKAYYAGHGAEVLAELLGRTADSIGTQANDLGLRRARL